MSVGDRLESTCLPTWVYRSDQDPPRRIRAQPLARMASRANKRQAAAGQEIPTTERREQDASQSSGAMSQPDLVTEGARWGTKEARQKQRWQRGGKAPASSCSHQPWRTYQTASRWWIRCEECQGRLASGAMGTQEDGVRMLLGWRPPTWPKVEPEDEEATVWKDTWTCAMCRVRLAYGTTGVITEVGKICMTCRTGPGKMKKKATSGSGTAEPMKEDLLSADEAWEELEPEAAATDGPMQRPAEAAATAGPTQRPAKNVTTRLTSKQIEFLEEKLTAKQWKELQIKDQGLSPTQREKLSEMLSAKAWQQLWA